MSHASGRHEEGTAGGGVSPVVGVVRRARGYSVRPGGRSRRPGVRAGRSRGHGHADAWPGERFRAESRAGNLNTYTESLSGRYGTDRIGLSLGYRWFHTNGFITVPVYQRGPVDRTDDSRHENFAGTLRIAPDAGTTITLGGNLFREDRTFGTTLSVAARTIGSVTLGLEHELGGAGRWEAKLFAQWQTFRNQTGQVLPSPP